MKRTTNHAVLLAVIGAVLLLAVLAGCASKPDYTSLDRYYQAKTRTIVVLPAKNETTDAEAPNFFLCTINTPLVDRGYYVIPSHLTNAILEHEGIDLGGESWEIEPSRLRDFIGADAVLYVTINEWDTNYLVIKTAVTVGLTYKLVDSATGTTLWQHHGRQVIESGNHIGGGGGPGGLIAGLIANTIDAALTAATTRYVTMAADVNKTILQTLPVGEYHEDYNDVQAAIAEWKKKQQEKSKEKA